MFVVNSRRMFNQMGKYKTLTYVKVECYALLKSLCYPKLIKGKGAKKMEHYDTKEYLAKVDAWWRASEIIYQSGKCI